MKKLLLLIVVLCSSCATIPYKNISKEKQKVYKQAGKRFKVFDHVTVFVGITAIDRTTK